MNIIKPRGLFYTVFHRYSVESTSRFIYSVFILNQRIVNPVWFSFNQAALRRLGARDFVAIFPGKPRAEGYTIKASTHLRFRVWNSWFTLVILCFIYLCGDTHKFRNSLPFSIPMRKMDQKEESSSSSSSVLDSCPICLSPILQESYLDQCFHKFCYSCILQWTKVVARKHSPRQSFVKCPLCKRKSSSIIYGFDGSSFQQHLIHQNSENSIFFTKAHKYRLQCYYVEPGNSIGNIDVLRYWKSNRYRQPNQWLYSWVSREIQALIQEKDVDIIVHHILGVIDSWRRNEPKVSKLPPKLKQEEFKSMVADAAKPFITGRTDRFVNELEMFLASGLNIEAYDKVYINHLGWKIPEIITEDDEEPDERNPLIPLLSFSDEDFDETT